MNQMKAYWQNTTADTRLWIVALGSGLIYLAFTAPYQLSRYYAVSPPVDYAKLTRYSAVGLIAYLVGIAGLFGLYLIGLRTLAKSQNKIAESSKLRFVFLGGLTFALILILSYPQTAIDLFVYAIRTRGWVLYGLSPFVVPPEYFPTSDPWLGLAGEWADAASPYGPVWEWLSLAAYTLSGGNYLGHLFALKIFSVLAYLGSAWLVYRIMLRIRPHWAVTGAAFFAWNPLVLFESVQNAHNDIIMVFFLLVAVWAYMQWVEQPKTWMGLIFIAAFTLSILVKFVTLIVLPFFLLGMALRQPNWARRILVVLLFGLTILLLSVLVMAPYWPGLENWAVLRAGRGAGRSVTALLVLALISQAGSTGQAFNITNGLIYLLFGVIYVWGLWHVACQGKRCFHRAVTTLEASRDLPIRAAFYIFFWYALFVATVFHAWYLLWFMPLAAIMICDRRIASGAFVFSLMALLIIPYYETIRVWIPYLNQNHILGHVIGVPLLLVPVLFSLWKPLRVLPE
ncbi:glycosyltransferase family 39 protein [Chloroflexota bacterium]